MSECHHKSLVKKIAVEAGQCPICLAAQVALLEASMVHNGPPQVSGSTAVPQPDRCGMPNCCHQNKSRCIGSLKWRIGELEAEIATLKGASDE